MSQDIISYLYLHDYLSNLIQQCHHDQADTEEYWFQHSCSLHLKQPKMQSKIQDRGTLLFPNLRIILSVSPSCSIHWRRLVQFWLNLCYKCYLILLVYNSYTLLLILYLFYTHLICQIRIKFGFASIFCQFCVL